MYFVNFQIRYFMSLVFSGVSFAYPGSDPLFSDITFTVRPSERVALVGPNGSGKTTLLRIAAGLQPAAGSVSCPAARWYLPQNALCQPGEPVAELLGVARKLAALHAIESGRGTEADFSALDDDWGVGERLDAVRGRWGIASIPLDRPFRTLSGGERTRVLLAGAELSGARAVLLDEPSNHLDARARTLLYDYVGRSRAAMLIVSHDRALLELMDAIVELDAGRATRYGGNYTFYSGQRSLQLEALRRRADERQRTLRQARERERQLAERRQRQESRAAGHTERRGLARIVAGGLASASERSAARLEEERGRRIERIAADLHEVRARIVAEQPLSVHLHSPERRDRRLLAALEGVNVRFGDRMLWPEPLSLELFSGERLRIRGGNGTGKTTLLRLLTGELLPACGSCRRAEPLRTLLLDQEYSALSGAGTVGEFVMRRDTAHRPEGELRAWLDHHCFAQEQWTQACDTLSGGEKLKLLLFGETLGASAPDLLLLDEPTNNVDLRSQELLLGALSEYKGTVVAVSHDEPFLRDLGITAELALVP